ncbi:MAG: HAMP domain-containing protein [Psychrobium sp.]|nr:HAMP domain-containing protein [Psychrobium sp.]
MPKTLFIKLLIGFWSITVLIAGAIVALPTLLEASQTITPKQLKRHLYFVEAIKKATSIEEGIKYVERKLPIRIPPPSMKRSHKRSNKRHHTRHVFVMDADNNSVPNYRIPKDIHIAILSNEENSTVKNHPFKRWTVYGPYRFEHKKKAYSLFLRDINYNARHRFLQTLADNRLLLLLLVMSISAICCALLAWHITRPIKSLDKSARLLAQGDLTIRAEKNALRHRDEIGQLAHSFNAMADSVEKIVLGQQRLLGDISHELRTPLTRLQLASAISRRQSGETPELIRIDQETKVIDKMLQQLLVLSHYKLVNDHPVEQCQFDFFMDDILENAKFEANEYNVTLNSDIGVNIEISVQWEPLASAIENIIRNAIRYASTQVTFTAHVINDSLEIAISDDGKGVAAQHLEHLFTPFYRVSSARERDSGGTGLGLAIAYAAISRHQGSIQAENNQQGGLSVKIKLPIVSSHS